MRISSLILLFTAFITACGPSDQEQAQQQERQMQMQMQLLETTPEFNAQMAELLDHYFDLKNALVASDADEARNYGENFRNVAEDVDAESLNEETLALWIQFSEVIVTGTSDLIDEDDVDDQRYHFESISEAMIDMVEMFQPVGYVVYHQSCPMVRGGSADWLSREEQIANPYHGDRMMRCGEVIRRL